MSGVSKYYKLTEQMLMEYIPADLFDITLSGKERKETDPNKPGYYYVYVGKDEGLYLLYDLCVNSGEEKYSQPALFMNFPDESRSLYTYPGFSSSPNIEDVINSNSYLSDSKKRQYESSQYYSDTIRIYFINGFTLNDLLGYCLKVEGKCSYERYDYKTNSYGQYIRNNNNQYIADKDKSKITDTLDLTILDYYLPKEIMKDAVHWLPNPFYMNLNFYDRYIEVKFPSFYQMAHDATFNLSMRMPFIIYDNNSETTNFVPLADQPLMISFATVSEENTKDIIEGTEYGRTFILDPIVKVAIKPLSNTDYFNIRIYNNPFEPNVIYYPVYGMGDNAIDLNLEVMNNIESGKIALFDNSFYDINLDAKDFYDMYGDDARKWIVYNELNITYDYAYYLNDLNTASISAYQTHSYFTNIIDYQNKMPEDGAFWRSTFVPSIQSINNMYCNQIIIQYTCRLVNRLSGSEAIRTASIVLDLNDINRYQQKSITLSNITTYKVINKIDKRNIFQNDPLIKEKEKYIRTYYDATNVVAKDMESGSAYTQGLMTLRLKHSSTNYMIRLFTLNEDNIRIPYDLTGPYTYKLVFPGSVNDRIEIMPNIDNKNSNLGIGSLVYYIPSEIVKQIMNIPEKERYFAIVLDTENTDAQETTLYEGKVAYY